MRHWLKTGLGMVSGLTLGLALLAGCSSLEKKRCNPGYAWQAGYDDAKQMRPGQPGLQDGRICKEEYAFASFQKDYLAGLQRARLEVCNQPYANELALKDALESLFDQPSKKALVICPEGREQEKLLKAYEESFRKTFCSKENATRLAQNHANAFAAVQSEQFETHCSGDHPSASAPHGSELAQIYLTAYRDRVSEKCSAFEVHALGVSDARAKLDMSQSMLKLKVCPKDRQSQLLSQYSQAFNETKELMLKEEELDLARKRAEQERQFQEKQLELLKNQKGVETASFEGRPLKVKCDIESTLSRYSVEVNNPGPQSFWLRGHWNLKAFDARGQLISQLDTHQTLYLRNRESRKFYAALPTQARLAQSCDAELLNGN